MRKPYIAPSCEYMTFTVDSAIASTACANNGALLGANSNKIESCSVTIGALNIFAKEGVCSSTDTIGYCYYYQDNSIFGS